MIFARYESGFHMAVISLARSGSQALCHGARGRAGYSRVFDPIEGAGHKQFGGEHFVSSVREVASERASTIVDEGSSGVDSASPPIARRAGAAPIASGAGVAEGGAIDGDGAVFGAG